MISLLELIDQLKKMLDVTAVTVFGFLSPIVTEYNKV
jgi:hypothetical protein